VFCKECGKEINDKAVVCVSCGVPTVVPQKGTGQSDAIMRMLLPVGRSKYAIAAGYLGLVSVLLIFAPFALLFGILAVKDIKKNKDKHGMGRAIFGIVMGAIFSVLLVLYILR
jgi:hypothetical protein